MKVDYRLYELLVGRSSGIGGCLVVLRMYENRWAINRLRKDVDKNMSAENRLKGDQRGTLIIFEEGSY